MPPAPPARRSPPAAGLALLALTAAAGAALAQPAAQPSAQEEEPPAPGPFLAASIGGGELGDAAPGLRGGGLGLRGHLELGYGDGRFVSGALSLALARAGYDNDLPPPEMVTPDADLGLRRIGVGAVGEARLPLGWFIPTAGAGLYADHVRASAGGTLLGVHGDYFEESGLGLGVELRAGADLRIHRAVQLGARAGWSWTRADLAQLTAGPAWLSGPWLELRLTFDASGFRFVSGAR
jgi:hypothetical protein